jgi:PAS domain S-box-containing protein
MISHAHDLLLQAHKLGHSAQPREDELLHFFNQSPDLLCIAGYDGIFKRLNPAWSALLGWTNEELQARPFLDFVHPEDGPATLTVMDQLNNGVTTIFFENRYRCKDGTWKWLRWTARPLLDRQEIYAIARDVTRNKHLELQILAAGENEQQRISRDLHDSLGPHLAAIRYAATFLADELRQRDPAAAAKADRISEMSGTAVTIARDLAHGAFPVQLDGLGLALALEELAATTSRQTDIRVTFSQTGGSRSTDPADDLHLYRIAQEALSNAAKHSAARHVTLVLHHGHNALRLTVADDGTGLPSSPHDAHGMGLDSMRYRAHALGGKLTLDSLFDKGTVVTCEIPIRPIREDDSTSKIETANEPE